MYKPTIANLIGLLDSLEREYGRPAVSTSVEAARERSLRSMSFSFPPKAADITVVNITNYQSDTAVFATGVTRVEVALRFGEGVTISNTVVS